jgi:hypothetical protein
VTRAKTDPVRKLAWEKQSHRRYSAQCGPGRLEVRKVGIAGIRQWWTVGEVFGRAFHSSAKYPCPETTSLYAAQAMAERVAADMIAEFKRSPLGSRR